MGKCRRAVPVRVSVAARARGEVSGDTGDSQSQKATSNPLSFEGSLDKQRWVAMCGGYAIAFGERAIASSASSQQKQPVAGQAQLYLLEVLCSDLVTYHGAET